RSDSLIEEVSLPIFTCPGQPFYNPLNRKMYFLPLGSIWVPEEYKIIIFDCETNRYEVITIPNRERTGLYEIIANWQENKLYFFDGGITFWHRTVVLNMDNNQFRVIDSIGGTGAWASRHNRIYASSLRESSGVYIPRLAILDGKSDSVIGYIDRISGASQIVYDSIDDKIYAFGDSGLFSISCSTNNVLRRFTFFPAFSWSKNLLWNHQTNHLFLIHRYRISPPEVYVIDCQTDSILTCLTRLHSGCITWHTQKLFSLLSEKNRIYISDCGIGLGKMMVIQDEPSGIREGKNKEEIFIFPSITNNRIKLKLPFKEKIRIMVYDILGRSCGTFLEGVLEEGDLSLGRLSPGVYLIAIEGEDRKLIKKVVIIGTD
ncbi:MAG: T9SS type A sorting domain-containing protein, partial [candidate division WOR-3 bacterium]